MLETVQAVLLEKEHINPEKVDLSTNIKSLGIDSLSMVEIACELETIFNIEIDNFENINTIGDLVSQMRTAKDQK